MSQLPNSLPYDLLVSVGVGVVALVAAVGTSYLTSSKLDATSAAAKVLNDAAVSEAADGAELRPADSLSQGESRGDVARASARRRLELEAISGLVTGYHEQALSQARAQFWFSVVAASIGFALIVWTGWGISTFSETSKILPGIVMDSVAFLFFKQSVDTRQRATELYDRLRTDRQISESVSLVSSIDDGRIRSIVKAQIALHMSGLSPAPIDLTSFLAPTNQARRRSDRENTNAVAGVYGVEPPNPRDHRVTAVEDVDGSSPSSVSASQ